MTKMSLNDNSKTQEIQHTLTLFLFLNQAHLKDFSQNKSHKTKNDNNHH